MALNFFVTLHDLTTINDLLVSLDDNSVIAGVTVLLMVWSEITSGGMVGEKVSREYTLLHLRHL